MSELTISGSFASAAPGMCSGRITKLVPVGSVGVLLPGMEARIVVPSSDPVSGSGSGVNPKSNLGLKDAERGKVGELWLRGGNVSRGYFNDEKSTRETFGFDLGDGAGGGWLRTGDQFWIDEDGFLL
jgi:acyl-CoA synthetase (AMP-forming)/AMP-acid ligase II